MTDDEKLVAIRSGKIDINANDLYFKKLINAFLVYMRSKIVLNGKIVPHRILNSGDDILFLENKGQDESKVPETVSNENYIYNEIPRCMVGLPSLNMSTGELSNPFSYGTFQLDIDGVLTTYTAQFRRIPVNAKFELKYYLDTYNDSLMLMQEIIAKLSVINDFRFEYLGQEIPASFTVPEDPNVECNVAFAGDSDDSKLKTISMDIDLESAIPIYIPATALSSDTMIGKLSATIKTN